VRRDRAVHHARRLWLEEGDVFPQDLLLIEASLVEEPVEKDVAE